MTPADGEGDDERFKDEEFDRGRPAPAALPAGAGCGR